MCQAQSFCQRGGHSWSPVWQLTCHRTSEPNIFLRSNTCQPPPTSIALAKWKIDTHNCDWNIFLPTIEIAVLGILACDYRQTPTGRRANGLRADLTPLMHGSCCPWQVSTWMNSCSHTLRNSSGNVGIRNLTITQLIYKSRVSETRFDSWPSSPERWLRIISRFIRTLLTIILETPILIFQTTGISHTRVLM